MLVNKDFLTWLLIGWRLCYQPIRCQFWKSLLTNMDFIMEMELPKPLDPILLMQIKFIPSMDK